jgi:hypothetical protein
MAAAYFVRRMQTLPLLVLMAELWVATAMSRAQDPAPFALSRDGSSFQRAIIAKVAKSEQTKWEMSHFPPFHVEVDLVRGWARGTVSHNGRRYDVYELRSTSGEKIVIYFDVGEDVLPVPNQAMWQFPDSRLRRAAFRVVTGLTSPRPKSPILWAGPVCT